MRKGILFFAIAGLTLTLPLACGESKEEGLKTLSKGGEKFVEVHYDDETIIYLPIKRYMAYEAFFQRLASAFNSRKAMTMQVRNELISMADEI